MVKYSTIRSFRDTFRDHTFTLSTSPLEKVNYLWQQESFLKENVLILRINTTVFSKKTNTVCRYMYCVSECDYKEKFIFDFNQNSLIVEATHTEPCLCSLSKNVKHKTYQQIKNYISESNQSLNLTPTIIQERLLCANQSGQKKCN